MIGSRKDAVKLDRVTCLKEFESDERKCVSEIQPLLPTTATANYELTLCRERRYSGSECGLWKWTARFGSQPSHLLAVRLGSCHLTSLSLTYLTCKMEIILTPTLWSCSEDSKSEDLESIYGAWHTEKT